MLETKFLPQWGHEPDHRPLNWCLHSRHCDSMFVWRFDISDNRDWGQNCLRQLMFPAKASGIFSVVISLSKMLWNPRGSAQSSGTRIRIMFSAIFSAQCRRKRPWVPRHPEQQRCQAPQRPANLNRRKTLVHSMACVVRKLIPLWSSLGRLLLSSPDAIVLQVMYTVTGWSSVAGPRQNDQAGTTKQAIPLVQQASLQQAKTDNTPESGAPVTPSDFWQANTIHIHPAQHLQPMAVVRDSMLIAGATNHTPRVTECSQPQHTSPPVSIHGDVVTSNWSQSPALPDTNRCNPCDLTKPAAIRDEQSGDRRLLFFIVSWDLTGDRWILEPNPARDPHTWAVQMKWWCFRPLLCTLFRLNWANVSGPILSVKQSTISWSSAGWHAA